jgi:SAM-dependent methyltransferase
LCDIAGAQPLTTHPTDHFSAHAQNYARFRPTYPTELFAWLASQSPGHRLAWDCGTGNGQAALGLADHFVHVHATDLSPQQLAQAPTRENIRYQPGSAESSGLADHSVDLVTVAQALHWFDHEHFYPEVRRVLRPGGVFAAWTYRLLDAEPAINAIVAQFHSQTVGPWWPPERRWVDSGYLDLPFPFDEVNVPEFFMERHWTLAQMLDYLRTWSATQRYIKERGSDPTQALSKELLPVWGDPDRAKTISWPLALRCGRTL